MPHDSFDDMQKNDVIPTIYMIQLKGKEKELIQLWNFIVDAYIFKITCLYSKSSICNFDPLK